MNESSITRDTVAVEESVHEIYQRLTEGNNPVDTPFRTMKDVFMWAASLGYQRGERKPIQGNRVTIFRWTQFSPQADIPLLKALAISDRDDVDILINQEDILTLGEEYANGGISILGDILFRDLPLWSLVETI